MGSLTKQTPVPLYHQLKTILLNGIEGGAWKPDDQLPTESDLATQYGVSKITVRQALRELANLGYVRREQGRGTFVNRPSLQQGPRELTSFTSELRRHGVAPSSRVLDHRIIEATPDMAASLEIPPGSPVFFLKRLRLAGNLPMGVQCAHIPLQLAPGIDQGTFENVSLYEVLATRYGLQPANARETHSAILTNPADAILLDCPPGAPALAAERITFLSGGRPLEWVRSVMRGDRYKIVLELTAGGRP